MRSPSNSLFWLFIFVASCSPEKTSSTKESNAESPAEIATSGMIEAPGLSDRDLVEPLADALARIDPTKDGWDTEAFNETAGNQLARLKSALEETDPANRDLGDLTTDTFTCKGLRPAEQQPTKTHSAEFVITTWDQKSSPGSDRDLPQALNDFRAAFAPQATLQLKAKLYKIEQSGEHTITTSVLFNAAGDAADGSGRRQINAEWLCHWQTSEDTPLLSNIELLSHEEVTRQSADNAPLLADCTASLLDGNPCYATQILRSSNHWRSHIPVDMGQDVVANVGKVVCDMNSDGLDDLYICQQGGLPNRLFLQRPDGTLEDATEKSGTGWLDYTSAALAVDLDNDGDRDLVVALQFALLLMRNDGAANFEFVGDIPLRAQTFSISAADYDLDGDLDLYACGYNATSEDLKKSGFLGSPMPFHDAENGGRNTLLRNAGAFSFWDVTRETGLDEKNSCFSFAASWEDYDLDGDPDLYVANDYGRNNFFRNDAGKFVNIAGELGIEDMSSGMSANWGDYNRDGRMDLYVSNMFSSAGNRITFQRQFQDGKAGEALQTFQRFARGNTLFEATADGGFTDVSAASGTTMARWAWGSRFADLDNDGWLDIVAANGFISAPDTGDL